MEREITMKNEKITGKIYGGRNVEESFSFPYKNVRKMACTCGYQGICVGERCKKCRQEVKVKINEIVSKKPFYNELKDIEKENNLLKTTLIVRDVFQNAKKYYLIKTEKLNLVFDIEKGEMFANEQNITYSRVEKEQEETENLPPLRRNDALYLNEAIPMIGERRGIGGIDIMELINHNYYNYSHPLINIEKAKTNDELNIYNIYKDLSKDRNILKDFFEFCAKERNVRFINMEKLLKEEDGVQRILVLLRLPILEYAEEIKLNVLSKEIAEKLDKTKDGKDIWKTLIGHHGKEVKKIALKDVDNFNHMMRWGKHILKQGNLVKIAKKFSFNRGQKKPMNTNDIVLGILSGVYQSEIYKRETTFFETMDEKQNMFEKGMIIIKSTHSNETVWVNRILQFKGDMNEGELYDYICDIGRMYEQVKKEFPNFSSKKTSIVGIHDELSSWIKTINPTHNARWCKRY